MLNKLAYAVIGVGRMGINHVKVLSMLPDVRLLSVADTDIIHGKSVANQFNVPFYYDYHKMLDLEKPQAVSICVPTVLHYQVAKACLQKKIHVLLEKPITTKIKEAEELLCLADQKRVNLLVGHIERFNPALSKIKDLLDKGELGEVLSLIAFRSGKSVDIKRVDDIAIDLAIHDVDIVSYLLGRQPTSVQVTKQYNEDVDTSSFLLKFGTTTAYIYAERILPIKIRKLHIFGSRGYAELDYLNQRLRLFRNTKKVLSKQRTSNHVATLQTILVRKDEPLKRELVYFIDCIRNDRLIDSHFALNALKIVLSKV